MPVIGMSLAIGMARLQRVPPGKPETHKSDHPMNASRKLVVLVLAGAGLLAATLSAQTVNRPVAVRPVRPDAVRPVRPDLVRPHPVRPIHVHPRPVDPDHAKERIEAARKKAARLKAARIKAARIKAAREDAANGNVAR
jgi:hypothetical protein